MRVSVEERVELERQRLGIRLAAVDAEASRLEAVCRNANESAQQMLALERAQVHAALDAWGGRGVWEGRGGEREGERRGKVRG